MKALYFNEHGGPEVMQYGDMPDPRPGPGEALVQVKAVALNHLDLWVRQGWPGLNLPRPHIGGSDVAGLVAGYGAGANSPALGTRVVIDPGVVLGEDEWTRHGEESVSPHYHLLGESVRGGCAEYVAVPAGNLLPVPDRIDFPQAAAPPTSFWRRESSLARSCCRFKDPAGGFGSATIRFWQGRATCRRRARRRVEDS